MSTKHFLVATEAELPVRVRIGGGGPRGINPLNFGGNGGGSRQWRLPNRRYQTGTWLFIAAVTMMFAGLTSTIVVRGSSATDWGHTSLPAILYLNTFVLLVSTVTFEIARRQKNSPENTENSTLLYATLALGLLFVGGQLVAWKTLVERGVYLASNPSSSTFYLLTAIHALHLIGGVLVLAYLVSRMDTMIAAKFHACLGAASLYWHFMTGLWLYILLLLVTRT